MSVSSRLTEVFQSAPEIQFDDTSRLIFFSDCHRGDNSWADNFSKNQNVYFRALEYYFNEGFTYFELGDGDELYENKYFSDICLMEQPFVKDPDKTIQTYLNETIAAIGENIAIRRFCRFVLGEGLAKKESDFAAEVAAAAGV